MNCDYTDIIMPIDYIPQAFEFGNRKLFHRWKMVGMQVTHGTSNGITVDFGPNSMQIGTDPNAPPSLDPPPSAIVNGIASGCKVIEEVNQNNHLVGRGAVYFRAKSNGTSSAAYGIMGHCNTPGIEDFRQYPEPGTVSSGPRVDQSSPFILEAPEYSPMFRSWGRPLDNNLCVCNGSKHWHMGAFIRDNVTGSVFFIYEPDEDCNKPNIDVEECDLRNTRRPGRFNARLKGIGKQIQTTTDIYRSCEAHLLAVRYGLKGNGPCKVMEDSLLNDITGQEVDSPFNQIMLNFGVAIKLTSLPACNHFEKVFQHDTGMSYPNAGYPGTYSYPAFKYRCERAVIRIAPSCYLGLGAGFESTYNYSTTKLKYFDIIEKHYDRWDVAEEGAYTPEIRYKVFDEVFEIPEIEVTVRVLAHKQSILEYYDKSINGGWNYPGFTLEECMNVKYVTGGKGTDLITDTSVKKGCTCSHKGQNDNYYPIRPYNQFNYCPNNFTCEKTC